MSHTSPSTIKIRQKTDVGENFAGCCQSAVQLRFQAAKRFVDRLRAGACWSIGPIFVWRHMVPDEEFPGRAGARELRIGLRAERATGDHRMALKSPRRPGIIARAGAGIAAFSDGRAVGTAARQPKFRSHTPGIGFSSEFPNRFPQIKKQPRFDEIPAGKSPIRRERQKTKQLARVVRLQLFPCMGQFVEPTNCSQGSSDARNQYDP